METLKEQRKDIKVFICLKWGWAASVYILYFLLSALVQVDGWLVDWADNPEEDLFIT